MKNLKIVNSCLNCKHKLHLCDFDGDNQIFCFYNLNKNDRLFHPFFECVEFCDNNLDEKTKDKLYKKSNNFYKKIEVNHNNICDNYQEEQSK